MTEKERQLIADELCGRFRLADDEEPSPQKLKEFLRIFTPEGAAKLAFERQQENRELYENLGLGAITPPTHQPQLALHVDTTTIDITPEPRKVSIPLPAAVSASAQPDDLEFDTF